jgi:hypothetical protein
MLVSLYSGAVLAIVKPDWLMSPKVVVDAVRVIDVQRPEPYCDAVHFIFRMACSAGYPRTMRLLITRLGPPPLGVGWRAELLGSYRATRRWHAVARNRPAPRVGAEAEAKLSRHLSLSVCGGSPGLMDSEARITSREAALAVQHGCGLIAARHAHAREMIVE